MVRMIGDDMNVHGQMVRTRTNQVSLMLYTANLA